MPVIDEVSSDHKMRWGGWLESPLLTRFQRFLLDGGRIGSLKKVLKALPLDSLLDVCCGLGDYAIFQDGRYAGIDNSSSFIRYAEKKNPNNRFILGSATALPFEDKTFDAALLACASHHLGDEVFKKVLNEMKRVSQKFIIVDDSIRAPEQSGLSRFFYSLDRGKCFRTPEQFHNIFSQIPGVRVVKEKNFLTFPGIHHHRVFILSLNVGT